MYFCFYKPNKLSRIPVFVPLTEMNLNPLRPGTFGLGQGLDLTGKGCMAYQSILVDGLNICIYDALIALPRVSQSYCQKLLGTFRDLR